MSEVATEYTKPSWDKSAQQFAQLIGYWMNAKDVRVRRRFYFGSHEASAIRQSQQKQTEWDRIVEDTRKRDEAAKLLNPAHQRTLPVWPKESDMAVAATGPEVKGNPSKAELKNVTIAEAKDLYLAAKKRLVGLAGGVGIKPATYNGIYYMLSIALGLSTAKKDPKRKGNAAVTRSPIDLNLRLNDLTRTDLENFRNFWMARPDGISVRTAINYCAAFKAMIDWADTEESFGFTKPKATDVVFNFRGMKKAKVVKVSNDQLKTLLGTAAGTPKTLLYVLLALQCGHYQGDIGSLLVDELRIIDGEPFLYRKRSKLKGVDHEELEDEDESGDQYVMTYLWPETYNLLKTYMAPKGNPQGRLLLNERGSLLWDEQVGETKKDAISDAYRRVCEEAKLKLPFQKIRKIGWNVMKRIGGSDDFARKWAGQQIQGISRWYNLDEFGDVTEALKKWREELVAAEVLPKVEAVEEKEAA